MGAARAMLHQQGNSSSSVPAGLSILAKRPYGLQRGPSILSRTLPSSDPLPAPLLLLKLLLLLLRHPSSACRGAAADANRFPLFSPIGCLIAEPFAFTGRTAKTLAAVR